MSKGKQQEYELLTHQRFSDGLDSNSDEETFFESPSLPMTSRFTPKLSNKRPWDCCYAVNSTRGVLFLTLSAVCSVLVVLFVVILMIQVKDLDSMRPNSTTSAALPGGNINGSEDGDIEEPININPSELSWVRKINPSFSELSLLQHDINKDGVTDLIIDSMTWRMGQDKYLACPGKPNACWIDFELTNCRAQLLALDGRNGSIVWETWVEFSTFAANCRHDLNLDGVPDCVFSGRVGLLAAINTIDGSFIWVVDPAVTFPLYSYYSPLMIKDFDRDGVIDLIVTHGGDPTYQPKQKVRSPGFIFVISGRTGQQLSERVPMPDGHETYSSPVAYNITGNIEAVLFGSGGETVTGSLWAVSMQSLEKHVDVWTPNRADKYRSNKVYYDPLCLDLKDINSMRPKQEKNTFKYLKNNEDWMATCDFWSKDKLVMWNPYQLCVYEFLPGGKTGTMQPPVIVDADGDGVSDLLVTQFNDHTILIDGTTASIKWNHTRNGIQSYSIPAPLYYNDDDKLDFLGRFSKGEWMIYDYSYMGVLDGESGELIWSLNCSLGAMSSPLTVKNRKKGHDGMLFLANGCKDTPNHGVHRRASITEDTCNSVHTSNEYEVCKSKQTRERRHDANIGIGNEAHNKTDENVFTEILKNLPTDLWEARNESDSFPNPWTETRSFIQDYCDIPYDTMVNRVYYLTPNMIKSGLVKPIYEHKPYVYKPPSSGYLNHKKRDETVVNYGDVKHRKFIRCAHILLPLQVHTTPVVGDFDNDGRLDAAMSILFDGMPNESSRLSVFHPANVLVKAFNIQDRLIEVFGSEIQDIVDFKSYYSATKQPWKQYMGSRADGVYSIPTRK